MRTHVHTYAHTRARSHTLATYVHLYIPVSLFVRFFVFFHYLWMKCPLTLTHHGGSFCWKHPENTPLPLVWMRRCAPFLHTCLHRSPYSGHSDAGVTDVRHTINKKFFDPLTGGWGVGGGLQTSLPVNKIMIMATTSSVWSVGSHFVPSPSHPDTNYIELRVTFVLGTTRSSDLCGSHCQ